MRIRDRARTLCERLTTDRVALCEVFVKEGRARRSEIGAQGPATVMTSEAGWAVRGGGDSGTAFVFGTGTPPSTLGLPAFGGNSLRLPEPDGERQTEENGATGAPLIIGGEAKSLLEAIARELGEQLSGARLLRAVLDDGTSSSCLVNSRGVDVAFRHRATLLHLEALWPGDSMARTVLEVIERDAQRLQPRALARRLADSLTVRRGAPAPDRDRGEMVLAPTVGARLLGALRGLWVGAGAAERARLLTDRDGRLGSTLLNVIDDGRLAGGPLAAPFDGEGVPTRRVTLVEQGRFVQPLVDWREADPPRWRAAGCIQRPGWRDLPQPGPSHLFVEPSTNVAARELVASVARGFYLLEVLGPVRVALDADRFAAPVSGFSLEQGRARHAIAKAWLCGSIGAFLRGIRGVSRDLAFVLDGGLIGSPSLLVGGLELRRELAGSLPG